MPKLPETGPSLRRYLRQQSRQALRQSQTSAFSVPLSSGIITADELAAPIDPAVAYVTATGFAPGPAWAEVVGVDLIVPATSTRLLLHATAWVYAVNNTAGADDLQARVSLAAVNGQAFLTPLAVGAYNTISAGLATLAGGLTPWSAVRLSVSAKTTTGTFTAAGSNTATLAATLQWLR